MGNRWGEYVAQPAPPPSPAVNENEVHDAAEVLRGVGGTQQGLLGMAAGDHRARFITQDSGIFWMGVHGGAGEDTLTSLLGGTPCHHRWPSRANSTDPQPPVEVVMVARQSYRGLTAAKLAATSWAAGMQPTIKLRGLVVIASAPGKIPRSLSNETRITAGGVPQTWTLPWIDELRLSGTVEMESLGREARKTLTALSELDDEIAFERK